MRRLFLTLLAPLLLLPVPALADTPASDADGYAKFIAQDTKVGPVSIPMRDQAVLNVPVGYAFMPEARARKFMDNFGNKTDAGFMGIVLPVRNQGWFSTLEYVASGYIRDDDAKTWNADAMIANMRKSTEEGNEDRVKKGMPAIEVLDWVERPHYDAKMHRLIWSVSVRDKDTKQSAATGDTINYRTLALGREGYIAIVMVTQLSAIEAQKPYAKELLANLNFNTGKRYSDFDVSTDHVAEYGLAALIGGVVAHKLGFLALIAAFALKFIKLIGIAILGGLAALRRFFGFRKKEPAQVEPRFDAPALASPAATEPEQQ